MKIERKTKASVLFKDLKKGDVFICNDGNVCMKTGYIFIYSNELKVNAITLDFGNLFFIEDDSLVLLPNYANLLVEE